MTEKKKIGLLEKVFRGSGQVDKVEDLQKSLDGKGIVRVQGTDPDGRVATLLHNFEVMDRREI